MVARGTVRLLVRDAGATRSETHTRLIRDAPTRSADRNSKTSGTLGIARAHRPRGCRANLLKLLVVVIVLLSAAHQLLPGRARGSGTGHALRALRRTRRSPGRTSSGRSASKTRSRCRSSGSSRKSSAFAPCAPACTAEFESTDDAKQESRMLTGDLNVANVEWIVQYKIKDPYQYMFRVRDVRGTLRDLSEAVMRKVVGDHSVTEVLTVGRERIQMRPRTSCRCCAIAIRWASRSCSWCCRT